jgi:crotonobetainyl-CoA:carnitine CoA-transferase CaiB-like acyl-CoA transferase
MGLIGGMARTAVVAGTATAVSNRVSRRQANRWAEQDQQQYAEQQAYAQPAPPPPPQQYQQPVYQAPPPPPEPAGEDVDTQLAQLRQLAQLKDQGVLTDAEFAAQKAKILNS